MMEPVQQKWITRDDLAIRLGIKRQTLADWAVKKVGPRYHRFGGCVRYDLAEVEAWEADCAVEWGESA